MLTIETESEDRSSLLRGLRRKKISMVSDVNRTVEERNGKTFLEEISWLTAGWFSELP